MRPHALNYNPTANVAARCSFPIRGCTISTAINFNPLAQVAL